MGHDKRPPRNFQGTSVDPFPTRGSFRALVLNNAIFSPRSQFWLSRRGRRGAAGIYQLEPRNAAKLQCTEQSPQRAIQSGVPRPKAAEPPAHRPQKTAGTTSGGGGGTKSASGGAAGPAPGPRPEPTGSRRLPDSLSRALPPIPRPGRRSART